MYIALFSHWHSCAVCGFTDSPPWPASVKARLTDADVARITEWFFEKWEVVADSGCAVSKK